MSTATKLQRTIERTHEKVQAGQFYEAHQAVRTIAARYIRQKQYNEAIEVLFTTSKLLLDHNEAGSASDLTLYMLQVYNQAEISVDNESRARLTELLKGFSPTEPTLKSIGHEVYNWASKSQQQTHGDPELNHVLGSMFVNADEAYEAEKYLLVGTKASAVTLATFLYEWYSENEDEQTAPFYLSRAVIGYLTVQNIRDARQSCHTFLEKLTSDNKIAFTKHQDYYVFDSVPLLDFLQLLVVTCQYQKPDMFKRLNQRYASDLAQVSALSTSLNKIGQLFFDIQPPRNQANMLQDLMSGLFQ